MTEFQYYSPGEEKKNTPLCIDNCLEVEILKTWPKDDEEEDVEFDE